MIEGVKRALPALAVLLMSAAIFVGLRLTRPDLPARSDVERVWPVSVVEAAPSTETPAIHAYGSIVATRVLDLRPFVAGEIVAVGPGLIDGGGVAKGDPLFTIDPFDYRIVVERRAAEIAERRARIVELEALVAGETDMLAEKRTQEAIAERDLRRRETLKRRDAGSEKALDDARMMMSQQQQARLLIEQTLARLEAQIAQERARLAMIEAEHRQAERDLQRTAVTAPFDAFVSDTDVSLGRRVGTNDRLARLIEIESLEARFHLSSRAYARLIAGGEPIGRPVRVAWRVGPDIRTYTGRIERLGAAIDPTRGGIELFARIDGIDAGTALRPGAFVEVDVNDRAFDGVVRLPPAAIGVDGTVYTVVDNRLRAQRVTIVAEDTDTVFVSGLSAGTVVVTKLFPEIGPGLRVAIRNPSGA